MMDEAAAREVVTRYGQHLHIDAYGTLVAAAAARVGDLNRQMAALLSEVRNLEAELIALHQLALWAQRDADPVDLGAVTDQAARTLI